MADRTNEQRGGSSSVRWSWTQPICGGCYEERYPGRLPTILRQPEREECCDCGRGTTAGIYLRVDPATVAHPTRRKDDDA